MKAHPTGRMYALYAAYLQSCLEQQSPASHAQDYRMSGRQLDTVKQALSLCSRAYEAGKQRVMSSLCSHDGTVGMADMFHCMLEQATMLS